MPLDDGTIDWVSSNHFSPEASFFFGVLVLGFGGAGLVFLLFHRAKALRERQAAEERAFGSPSELTPGPNKLVRGTVDAEGGEAIALIGDVSSVEQTQSVIQQTIDAWGRLDIVIANAGISIGMDTAVRDDIDVMAQTFATNNIGLAATFHPFIAPMLARGSGTLTGIASVAGIRGLPGHGAYCASKAAVISYCESLRGELRAGGVRVVTICPGYIDTPLTRQNRYSMPFLMQPEDFADKAFAAIEAGASYRVIPWQMGVVAGLLRLLPNAVFDRALAGRPRKHRQGGQ